MNRCESACNNASMGSLSGLTFVSTSRHSNQKYASVFKNICPARSIRVLFVHFALRRIPVLGNIASPISPLGEVKIQSAAWGYHR